MPEWVTIVLLVVMALVTFGVGSLIGFFQGYDRGLAEGHSRGEKVARIEGAQELHKAFSEEIKKPIMTPAQRLAAAHAMLAAVKTFTVTERETKP